MSDKIKQSYRLSKNFYDDALTQNKWWSRLYMKLFWNSVDDRQIAEKLLSHIPDDFEGQLLDVPVGTAVFTVSKYLRLQRAAITCLDYSQDMLEQARARFDAQKLSKIRLMQGDVGALPFEDNTFDIVLSMNGFHAFPDKKKALHEIVRVLKPNGHFLACYYIKGKSKVTESLVNMVLSRKGWFTPPFETEQELRTKLDVYFRTDTFCTEGSIVYFSAVKKK